MAFGSFLLVVFFSWRFLQAVYLYNGNMLVLLLIYLFPCDVPILSHCRNEALRVAFIDVVESLKDGKVHTEYYSKLVKADINRKDKVLIIPFLFALYTVDDFDPCAT